MKRMITIALMMTVVVMMAHAQGALKRVYNETIDPITQIDEGLQKAKAEGKFVIVRWVATGAHGACALPIS